MKRDIILAGVGGQGILSIATVIGSAALKAGLFIKQAEVHGMSQRGGDVVSHLRISDKEIFSDLIPFGAADLIISVEPMESLRYLPYLNEQGWLIANNKVFNNIVNYPPQDDVFAAIKSVKNHILLPADDIAKELKAPRSMNIVMTGAACQKLGIDYEMLEEGIKEIFGRKGEEVVNQNLLALAKGRDYALNYRG